MAATQKTAQLGKPAFFSDDLIAPHLSAFVCPVPQCSTGVSSEGAERLRKREALLYLLIKTNKTNPERKKQQQSAPLLSQAAALMPDWW